MNHFIRFRSSTAALLILATGIFFVTACRENTDSVTETAAAAQATPNIVFIHTDSILANYNVFQEKGAALARREQEENAKLQEKGRAIEQEVRSIQSQVQQGLLAPNQITREEQRIGQKQQQLMMERERITQELMMETQKLNQELQEKLTVILEALQAERGYDFILSYGQNSAVMMVNDALDITDEVLTRLNAAGQTQ